MPTLARKTTQITVRRKPSPQIAKLKERLASAARRARGQGGNSSREQTILTLVGAAGLALAEKQGVNLPTVANIDPALLYGGALAVLAPRYLGGKNGKRAQAVGDGLLAVAAHRAVQRGGVRVAGTEIDGEVGADEDLSTL